MPEKTATLLSVEIRDVVKSVAETPFTKVKKSPAFSKFTVLVKLGTKTPAVVKLCTVRFVSSFVATTVVCSAISFPVPLSIKYSVPKTASGGI